MSTARFTCGACGRSFGWKAELANRTVKCKCGQVIAVPGKPDAQAPATGTPKVKAAGATRSPGASPMSQSRDEHQVLEPGNGGASGGAMNNKLVQLGIVAGVAAVVIVVMMVLGGGKPAGPSSPNAATADPTAGGATPAPLPAGSTPPVASAVEPVPAEPPAPTEPPHYAVIRQALDHTAALLAKSPPEKQVAFLARSAVSRRQMGDQAGYEQALAQAQAVIEKTKTSELWHEIFAAQLDVADLAWKTSLDKALDNAAGRPQLPASRVFMWALTCVLEGYPQGLERCVAMAPQCIIKDTKFNTSTAASTYETVALIHGLAGDHAQMLEHVRLAVATRGTPQSFYIVALVEARKYEAVKLIVKQLGDTGSLMLYQVIYEMGERGEPIDVIRDMATFFSTQNSRNNPRNELVVQMAIAKSHTKAGRFDEAIQVLEGLKRQPHQMMAQMLAMPMAKADRLAELAAKIPLNLVDQVTQPYLAAAALSIGDEQAYASYMGAAELEFARATTPGARGNYAVDAMRALRAVMDKRGMRRLAPLFIKTDDNHPAYHNLIIEAGYLNDEALQSRVLSMMNDYQRGQAKATYLQGLAFGGHGAVALEMIKRERLWKHLGEVGLGFVFAGDVAGAFEVVDKHASDLDAQAEAVIMVAETASSMEDVTP